MIVSAAHPSKPAICPVCRGPKWQKHLEVCPGPMQRIADPPVHDPVCDCPPGAYHLLGCDAVYPPARRVAGVTGKETG